ncbi:MAG TPA: Mov34/MPN/PAD-1 family protein [Planctomycetota bacterium]|nr:Mov34/MPN/PAD-1 family protein [Planctomycetota bacterium]
MISIPPDVIRVMQDHAFAGYPGECCGLVFAKAGSDEAVRALPLENLQDKLHAMDPVEHPRTSRNGFQLNALKMAKAVDAAAQQGERLLGIFHSHIDCGAYFSQEDKDMAAPPPERVPNDPDLWHVVIECWTGEIRCARAFRWDGRDFAGHDLPGFARRR